MTVFSAPNHCCSCENQAAALEMGIVWCFAIIKARHPPKEKPIRRVQEDFLRVDFLKNLTFLWRGGGIDVGYFDY